MQAVGIITVVFRLQNFPVGFLGVV